MTSPITSPPAVDKPNGLRSGVTLLELILVMALLSIAVGLTFPALREFFRGRDLDLESRRLLSLTRHGQSRAVSEGIPMVLWIDERRQRYGLEALASYEDEDPKALEFDCNEDVALEVSVPLQLAPGRAALRYPSLPASRGRSLAGLPSIRFLPDGTIGEPSPASIELRRGENDRVWLVQTTNRLAYELRDVQPESWRR